MVLMFRSGSIVDSGNGANLSSNSATASRSASGSFARMWMALPFTPLLMSSALSVLYFSTVAIARFNADLPSSGFGNGTVGNVGSGSNVEKMHLRFWGRKWRSKLGGSFCQCDTIAKHCLTTDQVCDPAQISNVDHTDSYVMTCSDY